MTILVTDATGAVGRHLVRELLESGHAVRALARTTGRAALPPQTEVVEGDLSEPGTLAAAFDGIAAAHLVSFDPADHTPLTDGAEIVRQARTAGVERVTVLRGDTVSSPLDEAVAEDGGLGWTSLVPTELMANTLRWAASVREDGEVRDAVPDLAVALVHEADVASAAATALTGSGHVRREYRLTGPQALTPPDRVRVISDVLGREVRYRALAPGESATEGWRSGRAAEDVDDLPLPRATEAVSTVLPTVEHVTGQPPRTFARWVRENADAFGGTGVVTG